MYKGLDDGLTEAVNKEGDKEIRAVINSTTLKEKQKIRMLDILLNIREWENVLNGISTPPKKKAKSRVFNNFRIFKSSKLDESPRTRKDKRLAVSRIEPSKGKKTRMSAVVGGKKTRQKKKQKRKISKNKKRKRKTKKSRRKKNRNQTYRKRR